MIWDGWKKKKCSFECVPLKESREDCVNPGRGWYRVYSFDPKEPFPKEEWYWGLCKTETLALLLVDLGSYSSQPLPEEALENIEACFAFFQENQKELLVRFAYDRTGEAIQKEPFSVKQIQQHMLQIKPILWTHAKGIYSLQGLFVGNWGEMHGSRFLTEKSLKELWETMEQVVPQGVFLSVRTPEMGRGLVDSWNRCFHEAAAYGYVQENQLEVWEAVRQKRLGLFNDGLLGSDTDLGSYQKDMVEQELAFQDWLCQYVPNGGEVVGDAPWGELPAAIAHFSKIHLSYLNSVYDERVLNRWKNTFINGINGYAYIGMHLGYRFVVKSATLKKSSILEIFVENQGFSCMYEEAQVLLLLMDAVGRMLSIAVDTDVRNWRPGQQVKLCVPLPENYLQAQEGPCGYEDCFLKIHRKKDGRPVCFANETATQVLLIGRIWNGAKKRN